MCPPPHSFGNGGCIHSLPGASWEKDGWKAFLPPCDVVSDSAGRAPSLPGSAFSVAGTL